MANPKTLGQLKDNLNVPATRRTTTSYRLQAVMTARKKNARGERTMSFLDENGHWIPAVVLVGSDGKAIDLNTLIYGMEALVAIVAELVGKLEETGE